MGPELTLAEIKEIRELDPNSEEFCREFEIEDIWTTGCMLNTTGKVD
jgi:hypothetical protein